MEGGRWRVVIGIQQSCDEEMIKEKRACSCWIKWLEGEETTVAVWHI